MKKDTKIFYLSKLISFVCLYVCFIITAYNFNYSNKEYIYIIIGIALILLSASLICIFIYKKIKPIFLIFISNIINSLAIGFMLGAYLSKYTFDSDIYLFAFVLIGIITILFLFKKINPKYISIIEVLAIGGFILYFLTKKELTFLDKNVIVVYSYYSLICIFEIVYYFRKMNFYQMILSSFFGPLFVILIPCFDKIIKISEEESYKTFIEEE